MMSNGSVTIDLRARIMGYEASLRDLQDAMKKVDLGSDIGKKLARAISQAETQLKSLSKNLMPRVSSDTQVDVIVEKVNNLGDSIQTVAGMMQQINMSDLNLDAFGEEINKIQQQIAALNSELEGKLSAGMQSVVLRSKELKNVFDNILKIDTKDKSPEELFDALAKGAEEAEVNIIKLKKAYESAQAVTTKKKEEVTKIQKTPLATQSGARNSINKIRTYGNDFNEKITAIRAQMNDKLMEVLKDNTELNSEKLLDDFFGGLNPGELRARIEKLYSTLETAGIYKKKKDFYAGIFGDDTVTQTTQIEKLFGFTEIKNKFDAFIDGLTPEGNKFDKRTTDRIFGLLSSGEIDRAVQETLKAISVGAGKIQRALKEKKAELNVAEGKETTAKTDFDTANANLTAIQNADASLRAELTNLQNENAQLRQRIEALEQQAQGQLNTGAEAIRGQGARAGIGAQQWKLGEDAALKYKEAVEQVRSREQLVGRVQGVVQQWFSIYTVVNMVGNAVRSIISTIQELDKTITEIAIVTDMTQSDLWGQMDSYTEMARSYAASISGVYQVSQLFYQQGFWSSI